MSPQPDPDPWISQTQRPRIAVVGQFAHGGSACTLLFVRDQHGWLVYRLGLLEDAIRLSDADVRKIAEGLGGS
ncbi:MAG: hypothetical protein ACRDTC_18825 [Pseudonocardiaceae bacterium]